MATTNLGLVTPTTGVTVGQYVTGMNNNMGIIDGITINGKHMASAINLAAADVGAETEAGAQSKADAAQAASTPIAHATDTSNPHGVTAAQAGAVPTGRTLNGYDLSENRTLDGSDIAITGYAKSSPSPLVETDTITQALGKLEALTDEAKLKIATLDKTIADYKTAISELNPNQESTQTATGIGSVAIPKNAGGFVSQTVEGLTATNLVTNGDFSNGTTGWSATNSTNTVSNNVLSNTAGGSSKTVICAQSFGFKNKAGTKYYIKALVSVPTGCNNLNIYTYNGTSSQDIINTVPTSFGSFVAISNVITQSTDGSNNLTLYFKHIYADAATASGKVMQIKEVSMIDLTAQLAWITSPTVSDCNKRFAKWFGGTKSVLGDCALVSRGKNLFDKDNPLMLLDGLYIDGSTRIMANEGMCSVVIRCKPSTSYTISKTAGVFFRIASLDVYPQSLTPIINMQVLDSSTSGTITTGSNAKYLVASVWRTTDAITKLTMLSSVQLELGSTASAYEPYKSSTQYISTSEELRSVPNGVCDSITGGLLTRRVQKYTLTAGDITSLTTSDTNIDRVIILKKTDYVGYNSASVISGNLFVSGTYGDKAYADSLDSIGYISNTSALSFSYCVAKGAYANLAAARSSLAGTVIYYQLATPIEIPIDVSGDLQIYPSGSVTVEQKTVDAGLYNGGISVLKTRLPISALTYISKIDYATGVETQLSVSAAVVASGGLSFTHPDLVDGDIVFFEYEFDIDVPVPELNVEYYDSRYTVLDSVNGKYYRWSVTVANGVPTVAVTEV